MTLMPLIDVGSGSEFFNLIGQYKPSAYLMWERNIPSAIDLSKNFGSSCSTRYFIPVKIENSTCDIFLPLSALSSCVVCVFEPKYKSAAAAYVLLFLRNVTCASHAPYNIYTT